MSNFYPIRLEIPEKLWRELLVALEKANQERGINMTMSEFIVDVLEDLDVAGVE